MLSKKEIQKNRQIFSKADQTMTATFKVLSDINRYRIFQILAQQPKFSVSNIAQILDISLPLASQHIKILVHANILKKERGGKKIFPQLEYDNPFVQILVKTIKATPKSSK